MAVESMTGLVDYLKFGDDYGFVGVTDQETDDFEVFILWFNDQEGGGPSALFSMQLSIALVRRLLV